MTNINDFKKDGRTDWDAYNQAEIDIGERCSNDNCKQFIGLGKGEKRLCYSCTRLTDKEEINHENLVRCPKCGHTQNPYDGESGDIYCDGQHSIYCDECDCEYEITTNVSYTFDSPELLEEKNE